VIVLVEVVVACAKATLDPPTIERIIAVATTAEKSFLLTIFHLQNSLSSSTRFAMQ
jgi:hypothetical protein